MSDELLSEQRRQYTKKQLDRSSLTNPSIKCNAIHFIKPFEDTHLRLAPKLLQNKKSVYKKDFHSRPQIQGDQLKLKFTRDSVENNEKLRIDRSKSGYSKYLDVSATAHRIDYVPFSLDQTLGIGARDNITYWSWIKDETNKKYKVWPMKQILKQKISTNKNLQSRCRGEFIIKQNTVPNGGLTTETKSCFGIPDRRLDLAFKCISDQLDSSEMKTEN